MSLSRGLMLMGDDLNDYIAPAQACTQPPVQQPSQDRLQEAGGVEIHDTNSSNPTGEKVSISLQDCLACSGCVTSAEVVLVEQQSEQEVLNNLRNKEDRVIIASISPQTLASFAAKYDVPAPQVYSIITSFLTGLGVDRVMDISTSRDIALVASAQEFIHRYRASQPGFDPSSSSSSSPLPLLASACPGWVCYAEKTHPHTLPYISHVKSPQQIMGSYVKEVVGSELGRSPDKVYHISIMPCYDKKLEASRSDFYNDLYSTRDVDCVLTTGELERLFISERGSFGAFQTAQG